MCGCGWHSSPLQNCRLGNAGRGGWDTPELFPFCRCSAAFDRFVFCEQNVAVRHPTPTRQKQRHARTHVRTQTQTDRHTHTHTHTHTIPLSFVCTSSHLEPDWCSGISDGNFMCALVTPCTFQVPHRNERVPYKPIRRLARPTNDSVLHSCRGQQPRLPYWDDLSFGEPQSWVHCSGQMKQAPDPGSSTSSPLRITHLIHHHNTNQFQAEPCFRGSGVSLTTPLIAD